MEEMLIEYLKRKLNRKQQLALYNAVQSLRFALKIVTWPVIGRLRLLVYKRKRGLRLNLGCSSWKLPGFTNVDMRLTPAVDLTTDLNSFSFPPRSVACAFSHAFFEHLFRPRRVAHLEQVRMALDEDGGFICYMGLPDFRNIARFYLEKGPGTAGPVFDLFNVYRYTHGDPDRFPSWYLPQLHKALFDVEEVQMLLNKAGLSSHVVFGYSFPGDVNEVPVSLGFYATVCRRESSSLKRDCLRFLQQFDGVLLRLNTVEFLAPATEPVSTFAAN